MNKVKLPKVTCVNGIYLTKEAVNTMDLYQTGGSLNFDDWSLRTFDNKGIEKFIAKTNELSQLVLWNIGDTDEGFKSIKPHLFHLAEMVDFINAFRAPENVISKSA